MLYFRIRLTIEHHHVKMETSEVDVLVGNTIVEIKQALEARIGEPLKLKENGGRRKTIERFGVLEETFPSVFIIKLDQDTNSFERVSYSYTDVLTETVEFTFENEMDKKTAER